LKLDLHRIGRFRLLFGYLIGLLCLVHDKHELFMPGVGIALLGIAVRIWAAGHLQKNVRLATGGPYAFTRNPLYLGSFVLGAGVVASVRAWWLLPVYLAGFAVFYWPTVHREERQLLERFGDEYRAYRDRVPALLPWKFRPGEDRFSFARVIRNREHLYALGCVVFLLALEATEELRALLRHPHG